jgi:outer membrane protein
MKKIIMIMALLTVCCLTSGAFADQTVGFVDMTKILGNYKMAKDISNSVKTRQNEIQKMIVEAKNKIKSAKTDQEKEDIENNLTAKIQQTNASFQSNCEKQVQTLQNNILTAVKKTAENKKVDFVFKKDNLLTGGEDITDDVLSELNK